MIEKYSLQLKEEALHIIEKSMEQTIATCFGIDINSREIIDAQQFDSDIRSRVYLEQNDAIAIVDFVFDRGLIRFLTSKIYDDEFIAKFDICHDTANEISNIVCCRLDAYLKNNGYDLTMHIPYNVDKPMHQTNIESVKTLHFSNNNHIFRVSVDLMGYGNSEDAAHSQELGSM